MLNFLPAELIELICYGRSKPLDFQDLLSLRATCSVLSVHIPVQYLSPIQLFSSFEELISYSKTEAIQLWFSRQLIQSHKIKPISFAPLLLIIRLKNKASLRIRIDSCPMSFSRSKEIKFGIGIKAMYERPSSLLEFEKESRNVEFLCDAPSCDSYHSYPSKLNARGCTAVSAIVEGDLGQPHDFMLPPHWQIFRQEKEEIRMIGMERGSHRLQIGACLVSDEKMNRTRYLSNETEEINGYVTAISERYRDMYETKEI
jgi:hypothetical protein